METNDEIVFEITGSDLKRVRKFRRIHKDCPTGMTGEKLEYSFIPTGLGVAIVVKCSCGRTLHIGDFLDNDEAEYDEEKYKPLTEEDRRNQDFEHEALSILQIKDPRIFRIAFSTEQNLDTIYAIALAGTMRVADDRLSKCILPRYDIDQNGENKDVYAGLSDNEKIEKFYSYFESHVREELRKYNCQDKHLLRKLQPER
jgi:hypothetical protein